MNKVKALLLTTITILALSTILSATTPTATYTTLTGTFFDATGRLLNGHLTLVLPFAGVSTLEGGFISPSPVSFNVRNGAIFGPAAIITNDDINPANTYYITQVYDSSNQLIEQGNVYISNGTTFNIGAAVLTPATTNNISYRYAQSYTGNFTDTAQSYLSSRINNCDPTVVYGLAQGPGLHDVPAVSGCVTQPPGSTNHQSSGIEGMVQNFSDSRVGGVQGSIANAVGVYGWAYINANFAASWGGNFGVHCADGLGGIFSGQNCFGMEVDANLPSGQTVNRFNNTLFTGFVLASGPSDSLPNSPNYSAVMLSYNNNGVACNGCTAGTGPFPYGFTSYRGTTERAFLAGALCVLPSTGPCNSQKYMFEAYSAPNTRIEGGFQMLQTGDIQVQPPTGTNRVMLIPGAPSGLTLAILNGLTSLFNGSVAYCIDCKNIPDNGATAGAACVGSGSGAFAKRENNRWDCN